VERGLLGGDAEKVKCPVASEEVAGHCLRDIFMVVISEPLFSMQNKKRVLAVSLTA
jgi:hypothetical protein